MEKIFYEFGDKKYFQKELVMGQYKQLINALGEMVLPADLSTESIIFAFGDKICKLLAIVLIPDGINPKDKNLEEIEVDLENSITFEETVKVVEDFFVCNDIHLVLTKLNQTMMNIVDKIAGEVKEV